jgi:hypothetical protein
MPHYLVKTYVTISMIIKSMKTYTLLKNNMRSLSNAFLV